MAAALLERHAGERVEVRSAGSEPADELNPAVVEAMREVGIDLDGRRPRRLADEDVRRADVVVTMGCGDACPVYPGKRYEDWELDDPAGRSLDDVRPIRDEIERRVRDLVARLDADS
jgi:arsenate reductase